MKMLRRCLCAVGAVVLLQVPAVNAGEDWPMLGHDAERSGGTAAEIRPPFARKWYRLFADEGLQSGVQPVISGGKVVIGTLAGILHALDDRTGKDVWTYKTAGPILHAAAISDGAVFVGDAAGLMHAVSLADGKRLWSFKTGAAVWNAPAVAGELVFIGSRDGRFYALAAASGKLRWSADAGAPLLNSPAVDVKTGRVYIGSEAMRVHAFTIPEGREVWRSEKLPGASLRGYHPVIAPDGSVLVSTQPVVGYDRFQDLLLEMVREVFGDFASWRHKKEENDKLRAQNFKQVAEPATYQRQLDFLRRRLTEEPAFQTYFVLDPSTGKQRFVAPVVASESMNGPAAPPVVTSGGRVIVKYQVLLRSRYEHYSPFLNVGYLDTTTGHVTPVMDQSRTYGWHDSLLLVHDEQCQLSLAGKVLVNTHQDNVNAMDLETLKGYGQPFAWNIHEPGKGEALGIHLELLRGRELPPGKEWLIRGTGVYGGGSVLDVPVAIAGKSFYFLPTHELNAGCALIAYEMAPVESPRGNVAPADATEAEWGQIQELKWDWDTLATPRTKNLLEALPGPVPGTMAAPLTNGARKAVAEISNTELDEFIWGTAAGTNAPELKANKYAELLARLRTAVRELVSGDWQPLVTPAGKAPEEAYRIFNDPSETAYTLLLARPFLAAPGDAPLRGEVDAELKNLLGRGLARTHEAASGSPRTDYEIPTKRMRIVDDAVRDELARVYVYWLWSQVAPEEVKAQWPELKKRLNTPPPRISDDCGNSRLAGLMGYCRLAKAFADEQALAQGLSLTRRAMRERLVYELAHTRGGVIQMIPNGRSACVRWRRLTPDVARVLARYGREIESRLVSVYVDHHRPGWWLAWNVEQVMRNETPFQMPTTPLEIFNAKALIISEKPEQLAAYLDIPWCRADEFYIQKLALTLGAIASQK